MKALKLQKSRNDRKMMKNAKIIKKSIFCSVQLDASVALVVEHQASIQMDAGSKPTGGRILLFLY